MVQWLRKLDLWFAFGITTFGVLSAVLVAQGVAFTFDEVNQSGRDVIAIWVGAIVCGLLAGALSLLQAQRLKGEPFVTPTIVWTLDGHTDLSVRLQRHVPQVVLLEVGVKNPNRRNLAGIGGNVLIPEGLKAGPDARCDHYGEHLPGGKWMRPTDERLPNEPSPGTWKDYWADGGIELNPDTRVFIFKLRLNRAGRYHLKAKFWGGDLEEDVISTAVLEVTEFEDEQDLRPRDRIGGVILLGEALLRDYETGRDVSTLTRSAWVASASMAIPEGEYEAWDLRLLDGEGRPVSEEQHRESVRRLYDLRARV